jgi:DNA polymerase-1
MDGREYFTGTSDKGGEFFAWRVPSIREAIRAQEGWRIISADYSQIEVKLMAFLSQDPWLIEAINSVDEVGNHKDIHSYMCCELNGYDYAFFYDVLKGKYEHPECHKFNQQQLLAMHDEFTAKRGETKCTTFGIPYGAGEDTIGANIRNKKFVFPDGTIGLEPMEMAKRRAREAMDAYFKKAWKLKQWLNGEKRSAQEDAETRSILARRRVYDIPPDDDPDRNQKLGKIGREAGNHPIQASSADMTKLALVRFYSALRGGNLARPPLYLARLLMAVHDEIVCTAPDETTFSVPAAQALKTLRDRKASEEAKRAVLGPVPVLLMQSMEDAYNAITNELYNRVHRIENNQICYLRDVWNAVDVVIDDYWTKE